MKPRRAPERAPSRTSAQRHSALIQWLCGCTAKLLADADAASLAKSYGLDEGMVRAELASAQMRRQGR